MKASAEKRRVKSTPLGISRVLSFVKDSRQIRELHDFSG